MRLNLKNILQVIDLLPDAVLVVDYDGVVFAANKQVLPVFGYTPAELRNMDIISLIPERYRESQMSYFTDHTQSPGFQQPVKAAQFYGLRKNGEECDLDIALAPAVVDDKPFVIASVRDISELMQLERKLINRNEQLCVINSELERLGSIIAHDLKTPLLNIHAIIHQLKRDLSEQQKQHLVLHFQAIDQTLHAMLSLISGVADYSRAAITEHKEEHVDLNLVLKETCNLINFPPNTALSIPDNMPVVKGNKTKLIQVFLNLLVNAINYNNKDEIRIDITCTEKKNEVFISIADNGPGIPADIRESIFDLFWKGELHKENSQGIGLAVVKKIIEDKGGHIVVNDSALGGAEFLFNWPLEPKQAVPAPLAHVAAVTTAYVH